MYAYFALKYIRQNSNELKKEIQKRKDIIKSESLICIKEANNDIMLKFEELQKKGFLVGAIRPPTTKTPLFRISARISEKIEWIEKI